MSLSACHTENEARIDRVVASLALHPWSLELASPFVKVFGWSVRKGVVQDLMRRSMLCCRQAAHHIETCVVGSGVVGLAIARALSQAGHEVIVLEEAGAIGSGISSRNSEVIHAGNHFLFVLFVRCQYHEL